MRRLIAFALCVSCSVAGAATVDQGELIDPPLNPQTRVQFSLNSVFDRLQTFTVGLDGQFVGLRLQIGSVFGDASLDVSIVEMTGVSTFGATLGTATLQTTDVPRPFSPIAPRTIELEFDPFAVQVGDSLGILLDGVNSGFYEFSFPLSIGDATINYAGGALFFSRRQSAFAFASGGYDLPFETLVDTGDSLEVIPVPPAAPALLAGLGALALLRRRSRPAA
ncbi:MAG: hypothetical protein AAGB05_15405 [Pseudomonadota bacterium]